METGIYEFFDEKAFDDLIQELEKHYRNSKKYKDLQKANLLESTKIEWYLYQKLIDLNIRVAGVIVTAADPIICNTAEEYIDAAAKYDEGILEYASAQIWYKFVKQRIADLKSKNDDNAIGKAAFNLETKPTHTNLKAFLTEILKISRSGSKKRGGKQARRKVHTGLSKLRDPQEELTDTEKTPIDINNDEDEISQFALIKYRKEKTKAEGVFKKGIATRPASTLPTPHPLWEQFIFKKMNEDLQTAKDTLTKDLPYPFCDRKKMIKIAGSAVESAKWHTEDKEAKKGIFDLPERETAGDPVDWLNRGIWKPLEPDKEVKKTKIYMDSIDNHIEMANFDDEENLTIDKILHHDEITRVCSLIGVGSQSKKEQADAIVLLAEAYEMHENKRSYREIEEKTGYTRDKLKENMKKLGLT